MTNAGRLDKLINHLIIEMNGSENVIYFLESILHNKEGDDDERVSYYITLSVSNYFKLSVEELIDEGKRGREPALYRTICYSLHKDLLDYSIRRIGKIYKRQENAVFKGLRKIGEIEKNPRIDPKLHDSFMKIKEHVLRFSRGLKESNDQK